MDECVVKWVHSAVRMWLNTQYYVNDDTPTVRYIKMTMDLLLLHDSMIGDRFNDNKMNTYAFWRAHWRWIQW